ncbi:MAG: hypothetical protein N4A40_12970 [Tissierellales bacterium]|jgi:ABC-type dipeptide/oligopeptide/nickel transport system ATPase component|nr:hypothetical protein [Tissierellales bacterium]
MKIFDSIFKKDESDTHNEKVDNIVEILFSKRLNLKQRHGLLIGTSGSGKSLACQMEIENIIKRTNDKVIILNDDTDYKQFSENYEDVEYVEYYDKNFSFENHLSTESRVTIIEASNRDIDINKAMDYMIKKMKFNKANNESTWLYLDVIDIIYDKEIFFNLIYQCNENDGYLTIVDFDVEECIAKLSSRNINQFFEYIRIFVLLRRNDVLNKLAERLSIDSSHLDFDSVENSYVIIGNEHSLINHVI